MRSKFGLVLLLAAMAAALIGCTSAARDGSGIAIRADNVRDQAADLARELNALAPAHPELAKPAQAAERLAISAGELADGVNTLAVRVRLWGTALEFDLAPPDEK